MSNPTLRQTLNLADAALTNWQLAYRKESDYLVCNCCGVAATKPCLPKCEINNAMIAVRATLAQLDTTNPTQAHRESGERILRSAGDDLTHRGAAETVAGACDIENADLRAEAAKYKEKLDAAVGALERIAKSEDSPDIDATGDWQFGLHCGVEDRNLQDRYEGADYGHTVGVEKGLEWASNEATAALATIKEGK